MSGLSKSTGSKRNTNFWWYVNHRSSKGKKRKKQQGTTQDNTDKSNALEKVITGDTEKELEMRKSITGAGTGAIRTDSKPEVVLSKQARKRKLKREAAKEEKLEKKKKKLQLKGQGTFGKDKEQVRIGGEQKHRMKKFKRRRHKRKHDLEGSPSNPVVMSRVMSPLDKDTSNNVQHSSISKQRKRSEVDASSCEKGIKEPVRGKTQIDGDASRSGVKAHDTDKVIEVDKNWRALMKKIDYKPPKRNQMEEEKKIKLAETEADLKRHQEIWFDDVDPELLEDSEPSPKSENRRGNPDLVKGVTPSTRLTKYIGIDCEMVGIGQNGEDNMLARVSLVNQHGACVYDKFVAPSEAITDYRTSVSGITPEKVKDAENFATVQKEVYNIIKNRILVGHAVQNDLKVLFLAHPRSMIRDTSTYKPFRELSKTKRPSLKLLSRMILDVDVQRSSHDSGPLSIGTIINKSSDPPSKSKEVFLSVEDAQAAMKLFMLHRQAWEKDIVKKPKTKTKKQQKREVDTR